MRTARFTCVKDCHTCTHPADVRLTASTYHVIAPLHSVFSIGVVHVHLGQSLIKSSLFSFSKAPYPPAAISLYSTKYTSVVSMSLVTRGAQRLKTVGAHVCWKSRVRSRCTSISVDRATIWSWAVTKSLRVACGILCGDGLEDAFENRGRDETWSFILPRLA